MLRQRTIPAYRWAENSEECLNVDRPRPVLRILADALVDTVAGADKSTPNRRASLFAWPSLDSALDQNYRSRNGQLYRLQLDPGQVFVADVTIADELVSRGRWINFGAHCCEAGIDPLAVEEELSVVLGPTATTARVGTDPLSDLIGRLAPHAVEYFRPEAEAYLDSFARWMPSIRLVRPELLFSARAAVGGPVQVEAIVQNPDD